MRIVYENNIQFLTRRLNLFRCFKRLSEYKCNFHPIKQALKGKRDEGYLINIDIDLSECNDRTTVEC